MWRLSGNTLQSIWKSNASWYLDAVPPLPYGILYYLHIKQTQSTSPLGSDKILKRISSMIDYMSWCHFYSCSVDIYYYLKGNGFVPTPFHDMKCLWLVYMLIRWLRVIPPFAKNGVSFVNAIIKYDVWPNHGSWVCYGYHDDNNCAFVLTNL